MKKALIVLLAILLVATAALTLAACNPCKKGSHSWADDVVITTEATCEQEGVKTLYCRLCGISTTEKIEKKAHTWDEEVAAVDPTCDTAGNTAYKHCSVCNKYYNLQGEVIEQGSWVLGSASGHSLGQLIEEVKATCEQKGTLAHYHCSACGKDFADEDATTELEDLDIPALGHTWKLADNAFSWAEDGSSVALRLVCVNDSTHTDSIVLAGDDIDVDDSDAPTCTDGGKVIYSVSLTKQELAAKLTSGKLSETVDATLESSKEIVGKSLGHDYDGQAWIPDGQGNHYKECANGCGTHSASEPCTPEFAWDTDNHYQQCTVCDDITDEEAHDPTNVDFDESGHWFVCSKEGCEAQAGFEAHEYTAYNSDEDGHWGVCEACTYEDKDNPVDHEITWLADGSTHEGECDICERPFESDSHHTDGNHHEAVAGADCLSTGTVAYDYCDVCGYYIVNGEAVEELGDLSDGQVGSHPELRHIVGQDSTCVKDGTVDHWVCDLCGKTYRNSDGSDELKDTVIKSEGHQYADTWTMFDDETHRKDCAKCDAYLEQSHTWGTTAVAHDQNGHTLRCSDGCDATKVFDHVKEYTNRTLEQHTFSCTVDGCGEGVTENHDFGYGAYGSSTRKDCVCGEKLCAEGTVTVTAETFTDLSNSYGSSTKDYPANGVNFQYTDIMKQNGMSMNKNNNRNSAIWNTSAFGGKVISVLITLNSTNTDTQGLKIEFGTAVGTYTDTVYGNTTSTSILVVPTDGNTDFRFVKISHNKNTAGQMVITSIVVKYASGTHNWAEETTAAKCTEAGSVTKTCKRCGMVETEVLDPIGHTFTESGHHAFKDSDCVTPGNVEYWHCDTCGKNFGDNEKLSENVIDDVTIGLKAHVNEGEWKQGTGAHVGEHYQECKNCNTEAGRNYTACDTDDWYQDDDTNHWKICSVCGYNHNQAEGFGAHSYDQDDEKCVCGKNSPAHEHVWDEPVPELLPTCTNAGHPAYVHCSACDNYYSNTDGNVLLSEGKAPVTAAKGHSTSGAKLEDIGDGLHHGKKCSVCDQYVDQDDHKFPNKPTKVDISQHKFVCAECQYEKVESHSFGTASKRENCACGEAWCVKEDTKSVSITLAGLGITGTGYTSNTTGVVIDGVTFKFEKIAKNGDNMQTNSNQTPKPYIWNATAFDGDIRKVTVVLGGSYSGNLLQLEFSTDGTNYSTNDIVYVTAENLSVDAPSGYRYIRITYAASSGMRLFASITVDYAMSVENHVWQEQSRSGGNCLEGTLDNVTYKCARCGEEKTEKEPAKHTISLVDAQTATCTQQGWASHYECSVCHKWFSDLDGSEVVDSVIQDKLEHKLEWREGNGQHWQVCVLGNDDCDYEPDKQDHDSYYDYSETEHWLKCDTCGWVSTDKQGHNYDQEGSKCVCGLIDPNKHTHSYDLNKWNHNDTQHWRVCDEGDFEDTENAVAHDNFSYSANGADKHDAHCLTCDGHVEQDHTKLREDMEDDNDHMVYCEFCEWDDLEAHHFVSFDNSHDGVHDAYCDLCQATVEQAHDFDKDSGECACGEKKPSKTYFVKVENATTIEAGRYLIVYEAGNVILDANSTTKETRKEVTITDKKIEATEDILKSSFNITYENSNWYIASSSLPSTYYLGQNSNANGSTWSATKNYNKTISVSNGDATIISSGGAYLRYNSTNSPPLFRYYKSSSYTSQSAVQLYMLQD